MRSLAIGIGLAICILAIALSTASKRPCDGNPACTDACLAGGASAGIPGCTRDGRPAACVWRGDPPFCYQTCEPGEQPIRYDPTGARNAEQCMTGKKVLCCSEAGAESVSGAARDAHLTRG